MSRHHANAHPVLIIGAGRGGAALLEMFLEDRSANVICVVDPKPEAQGIKIAQAHGIPTCASVAEALHACQDHKDCIVYNLTHDDAVAGEVAKVFGNKKVTGGAEARLFWQIVTNLKETKRQLEQNQQHMQAIIDNAMDGIVTINERGEIQAFNPAAERIFGYSQQEVLGRNLRAASTNTTSTAICRRETIASSGWRGAKSPPCARAASIFRWSCPCRKWYRAGTATSSAWCAT